MYVADELEQINKAWIKTIKTHNVVEINGISISDGLFITRCLLNCCLSRSHRIDNELEELQSLFVEIALFASNHKVHFMHLHRMEHEANDLFNRVAAFVIQHFYSGRTALSMNAEKLLVSL
jgi:hypothetical protein